MTIHETMERLSRLGSVLQELADEARLGHDPVAGGVGVSSRRHVGYFDSTGELSDFYSRRRHTSRTTDLEWLPDHSDLRRRCKIRHWQESWYTNFTIGMHTGTIAVPGR